MRGDGSARGERVVRGGDGISSTVLLTLVDDDGKEWIAAATMTRARPKGAPDDAVSVQLTESTAYNWRIKEFRVVEP
jgi:hypothetical protein